MSLVWKETGYLLTCICAEYVWDYTEGGMPRQFEFWRLEPAVT